MNDLITISDARANLPSIVNKVSEGLSRFLITVNNKPKAVILSVEEMESLEETAEILSIPGALKSIKAGYKQAKKGKGISLDDFQKKYEV
jgi:prevent-host-death family protein